VQLDGGGEDIGIGFFQPDFQSVIGKSTEKNFRKVMKGGNFTLVIGPHQPGKTRKKTTGEEGC